LSSTKNVVIRLLSNHYTKIALAPRAIVDKHRYRLVQRWLLDSASRNR